MKRTFPVNINSRIFYIDNDAYELLNNYLEQIKRTFPDEDGQEIASDIETRIGEHFMEETAGQNESILTLELVKHVIATLGSVEDLTLEAAAVTCDSFSEGAKEEDNKNSDTVFPPHPEVVCGPSKKETVVIREEPVKKKLFRSRDNRILGGVIGGMAVKWGWNPDVARLIALISIIYPGIGPAFIIYAAFWVFVPQAKTSKDLLEMYGIPMTLDNLSKTILQTEKDFNSDKYSGWGGFHKFLEVCSKIFAGLVLVSTSVFSIFLIGCLTVKIGEVISRDIRFAAGDWQPMFAASESVGYCFLIIGGLIFSAALIWMAIYLFSPSNIRTPSKKTVITTLSIALFLVIAGWALTGISLPFVTGHIVLMSGLVGTSTY